MAKTITLKNLNIPSGSKLFSGTGSSEEVSVRISCDMARNLQEIIDVGTTDSSSDVADIKDSSERTMIFSKVNSVGQYDYKSDDGSASIECSNDVSIEFSSKSAEGVLLSMSKNTLGILGVDEMKCLYAHTISYRFYLPSTISSNKASFFNGSNKCISLEEQNMLGSPIVSTSLAPCCPDQNYYYELNFLITDSSVITEVSTVLLSFDYIGKLVVLPKAQVDVFFGDQSGYSKVVKIVPTQESQSCDIKSVADTLSCENLYVFCSPTKTFYLSVSSLGASFSALNLRCDDYITDYTKKGEIKKVIELSDVYGGLTKFDPTKNEIGISYKPYKTYESRNQSCATSTKVAFKEIEKCQLLQDDSLVPSTTVYDSVEQAGKYNYDNNSYIKEVGAYLLTTVGLLLID